MTKTTYRDIAITHDALDGYSFELVGLDFSANDLDAAQALIDSTLTEIFEHRGVRVRPSRDWGFVEFDIEAERFRLAASSAKLRRAAAEAVIDALV